MAYNFNNKFWCGCDLLFTACTIMARVLSRVAASKQQFIDSIYEEMQTVDGFVTARCSFQESPCLLLTHKELFDHPPFGMTSHCRISITAYEYVVHILMRETERGSLDTAGLEIVRDICKYAVHSAVYKFCPGIDPVEYE